MKHRIIACILLAPFLMQSAEESSWQDQAPQFGFLAIEHVSDDEEDDNFPHNSPPFNQFFRNAYATINTDDTEEKVKIKTSLFVQLCVQAAKINDGARLASVRELLTRIKHNYAGIVEGVPDFWYINESICITLKDIEHRLLPAIPTRPSHGNALINHKKIDLELIRYATEEDKQENERRRRHWAKREAEKEEQAPAPEPHPWGQGIRPCKEPYEKQYSGWLVQANYHFDKDPEHHHAVVKEFEQLLAQQ